MAGAGLIVIREKSPYEFLDYETSIFLTNVKGLWQSFDDKAGSQTKLNPADQSRFKAADNLVVCTVPVGKHVRTDARVTSMIQNFYSKSPMPFETALKLMYNAGDFNSSKPMSLSVFFISVFAEWLEINKHSVEAPEPQVKIDALKLVLEQKNASFNNLVIKTFDMASQPQIFLPVIHELLQLKNYKDACQTVAALDLYEHFGIEDFLIPLYLQDKLVVIEDYLSGSKQCLTDFVSFLDNVLEGDTRLKMTDWAKRLDMHNLKLTKCEHKPLSKFLMRLLKKFNLPGDMCPVLMRRRHRGALHFLMARRFGSDGEGNSMGWAEMALEAVGDSPELQEKLVLGLVKEGQLEEAQQWRERFNLPSPDTCETPETPIVSISSIETTQPNDPFSGSLSPETSDVTLPCLHLPFPKEDIIVVDSSELLARFTTALDGVNIVGMDCEWKPSFGISDTGLSLIQVALRDEVYLLDVPALTATVKSFSSVLLENLFNNKKLMKIGFNISGDVKAVQKSIPEIKEVDCVMDLASVWLILVNRYDFRFPCASDPSKPPSSGKLKDLVALCLGKRLDKTEQFSNWDLRPLRPQQILYAALDAYCLLEVYNTLKDCCAAQNIPLEDVVQGVIKGRSPKYKFDLPVPVTVKVSEVDVVCTDDLWMLAQRLRLCGINVCYMTERRPTTKVKKLLIRQGYYLLATNTPTWHCSQIKMVKVPQIETTEVSEQLHTVLQHLNVHVTEQDCGTRCLECNSNMAEDKTRQELKAIIDFYMAAQHRVLKYKPAEDYYEDDDYDSWDDLNEPVDEAHVPPVTTHSAPDDTPCDFTQTGKKIQADRLPSDVLDKYEIFKVCSDCGLVRSVEQLSSIFKC